MALCHHARRGIVTNQPGAYDPSRPHAAASVCDRPACIREAKRYVAAETNETAVHVPDVRRERQYRRDAIVYMALAVDRYLAAKDPANWRFRDATELREKIGRLDRPARTASARQKRCDDIARRARWLADDAEEQSPSGYDALADLMFTIVLLADTYLPQVYAEGTVSKAANETLNDLIEDMDRTSKET